MSSFNNYCKKNSSFLSSQIHALNTSDSLIWGTGTNTQRSDADEQLTDLFY
jgi:hypothetical protein